MQTRTEARIAQSRAEADAARQSEPNRKLRVDRPDVGNRRRYRVAEGQVNARYDDRWVTDTSVRLRIRERLPAVLCTARHVVRATTRT